MFYKKKFDRYLKNRDIPFNGLQRLSKNFDQKSSSVSLLVAEQLQFLCRFFNGFLAENKKNALNWFLLSQTFNQKQKLWYGF